MGKAAIEVKAGWNQRLLLQGTQDFPGLLRSDAEAERSPQLRHHFRAGHHRKIRMAGVVVDGYRRGMAKSYYSVVLDHPADEVWAVIRQFDHYAWAGVPAETTIEEGKAGDQVGAIRRVSTGDKIIRQILLSHSDLERSYTYALCDPPPFPVRNYVATIRVVPVVEDGRAFVEWWATFDCAADEYDRWTRYFEKDGFAKWLSALRAFMQAA